jgi:hypothetical protein
MVAENAPSKLRIFLEEEQILSWGCLVSFEGDVTGSGHAR